MRIFVPFTAAAMLVACSRQDNTNEGSEEVPAPAAATAEATPDAAMSFDCAAARGQAEQAVCADASLAALDRLAAPGDAALAGQRNACGRADDLKGCLTEVYATQIATRAKGGKKLAGVTGPLAYDCAGVKVEATYVAEPSLAIVSGSGITAVLTRAVAASGERYEGVSEGAPIELWTKGKEAKLSHGSERRQCSASEPSIDAKAAS